MKRHGFTLMELLLAVAILAIIVVAVAPAWTTGSQQALEESRKTAFCSSYQNTVFAANLMMGVMLNNYTATSNNGRTDKEKYNGKMLPEGLSLDSKNQFVFKNNSEPKNLNYYAPVSSRTFTNLKNKSFFISAKTGPNQTVILYYVETDGYSQFGNNKGYTETAFSQASKIAQEIHLNKDHTLDDVWEELKNKEY